MKINVPLLVQTDGIHHLAKVEGETTTTPGLAVSPADHRYLSELIAFDAYQLIHVRSGALLGTFPSKEWALRCASVLGKVGVDWTHSRHYICSTIHPYVKAVIRRIKQQHKALHDS